MFFFHEIICRFQSEILLHNDGKKQLEIYKRQLRFLSPVSIYRA